jgi:hypothetical protein
MIGETGPASARDTAATLRDDVATIPALLKHPDHAGDLTLGASQPMDERRNVLGAMQHR